MIGQAGERYGVAKEFGGECRYLADYDFASCLLSWALSRQQAKPLDYQEAQRVSRKIPGAFVCKALVTPSAQTELPLWA